MPQRPQNPSPGEGAAPSAQHGAGDLRHALLASLGLPADATPEAVEAAHERVARYLTQAPAELAPWANQQAAAADAAHAVLTGEAGDVLSRRTTPVVTGATRPAASNGLLKALLALAVIAALVMGVYAFGPQGGTKPAVPMGDQQAAATAMPTPTPTAVDPAKVKELEARVAKNGKDVESMAALGNMYYGAGDYTQAARWREKILAVDPKDTDVLLSLGVALFNAGDMKGAEARWTEATKIDPKKAEAYYDLGFLALSQTPPDTAKAKAL